MPPEMQCNICFLVEVIFDENLNETSHNETILQNGFVMDIFLLLCFFVCKITTMTF